MFDKFTKIMVCAVIGISSTAFACGGHKEDAPCPCAERKKAEQEKQSSNTASPASQTQENQ